MTDGAGRIIDILDAAEPFVDGPDVTTSPDDVTPAQASAEDLRKFGLEQLGAIAKTLGAAAGDDRDQALTTAAEAVGQLVAAGALDEGFAIAALENAAAAIGLVKDLTLRGVRKAIAAALKAGKKKPRDVSGAAGAGPKRKRRPRPAAVRNSSSSATDDSPDISSPPSSPAVSPAPPAAAGKSASSQTGASPETSSATGVGGDRKPPDDSEDIDALNMRLAFFPLTDLGNAERFRERFRHKLLWNVALGWLVWDGKRWSRNGADDLVKIAEHDTVRAIQDEAEAVAESGIKSAENKGGRDCVVEVKNDVAVLYSDKIARWGRTSEGVNKLGALSKRGAPYLAIGIERLDADPMKINVSNGTLVVGRRDDADYVEFREHDPADLITKISPVDFDLQAQCPLYDEFLARVQPSADMRTFLHQWGGLSLTGDVSEQQLAFLYGKGSNGKSVLVDAWSFVAGDYGKTLPIETFLDQGKSRSAGQATPDLAILPGVRMLRTSEPEKNSRLAEAMIKLVTGGEPILARHLNRDFFEFYPQFKLTISGNYRPIISGADEGIWRRVRLVPFGVTIPKPERDTQLPVKLRREASGILNRLLDGLRAWLDKGLQEPEAVTTATAEYRSSSDPLGRFLETCVDASDDQRVQSSKMFQVFEAWCKSSGETVWKQRGFTMAMEERGYKRIQSNVMWFLDVKLKKSVDDFVDVHGQPRTIVTDGVSDDIDPHDFKV